MGGAAKKVDDRPLTCLTLQSVEVIAMIDTGAVRTLITEELYNALPEPPVLEPAPQLYGVTGRPLKALGEALIQIGRKKSIRMIVVRSLPEPVLIASDVLMKPISVMDLQKKILLLFGERYLIFTLKEVQEAEEINEQKRSTQNVPLQKLLEKQAEIFKVTNDRLMPGVLPPVEISVMTVI